MVSDNEVDDSDDDRYDVITTQSIECFDESDSSGVCGSVTTHVAELSGDEKED